MPSSTFLYDHAPRLLFHWKRITHTNYEREMELLDALCDRASTSLDIGAKYGMYAYRMVAHSRDVIAFDPIPLFQRFMRGAFATKPVRVEPVALSSAAGRVTMRLPYDHANERQFGRATIEAANELTNAEVARVETIDVETRTLDSYALDRVGCIKIDVEGHELAVLAGAEQTIAAQHPNLIVECNDEHQPGGVARLASWLAERDYQAVFVDGHDLHPIAGYDRAVHWTKGIENFLCTHASRGDVRERLADSARRRKLGVHRADH